MCDMYDISYMCEMVVVNGRARMPLPSISLALSDGSGRAADAAPGGVEWRDGRDRARQRGDHRRLGGEVTAAAEDPARQARPAGGDDAGGAQRQPDGPGGGTAAGDRAARHALPVDRAPAGQPAPGGGRGDGALRQGAARPGGGLGPAARADPPPDP